jgi:pimeloyl-ACP methyl ester carboxylesterase
LQLRDGRTLGFAEYGDPAGNVLFYFHGYPGARVEARLLAEPAERLGTRLIGIDRPGIGFSTFQARRRFLDWPADVAELADKLGIDRFSVVGCSGGGPNALAYACRIPDRLIACGIVAGAGIAGLFLSLISQGLPSAPFSRMRSVPPARAGGLTAGGRNRTGKSSLGSVTSWLVRSRKPFVKDQKAQPMKVRSLAAIGISTPKTSIIRTYIGGMANAKGMFPSQWEARSPLGSPAAMQPIILTKAISR